MAKDELFIKRVYELVNEMKLPVIDERVYDKAKIKSKNATTVVIFEFEEDESVIQGFLGLANYFHSVIIKDDDEFYIPIDDSLFILTNS
ncbi:MAG: hypothetical protein EU521_00400 [Promethearchaeota archaeon]|nr:MAG: hypothetical protein EU521_00400 [Candidatus Lokiarchaeota archaeon]